MNAKLKEMQLPPQRPKVNQVQRKYLQERLRAAERDKKGPDDETMPAPLVLAQKRIETWQRGQWRKAEAARNRVREARRKVEQVILFGTPEEALAAVEAFEKLSLR